MQQEKRILLSRGSYYHKNGNGNESVKRPIHNGTKNSFIKILYHKESEMSSPLKKKLKQPEIIQQTTNMSRYYDLIYMRIKK